MSRRTPSPGGRGSPTPRTSSLLTNNSPSPTLTFDIAAQPGFAVLLPPFTTPHLVYLAQISFLLQRSAGVHTGAFVRAAVWEVSAGAPGALLALSAKVPYDNLSDSGTNEQAFEFSGQILPDATDVMWGLISGGPTDALTLQAGGVAASADAWASAPNSDGPWTPQASTARAGFAVTQYT